MGKGCCAFTGHRNVKDDLDLELLEKSVIYLIEERGINTFYDGMARGFDLIAAGLVLKLKEKYSIRLIACVPCRGQDSSFSKINKNEYAEILKSCDEVIVLSERYYNGCMQARDRFMVDNAEVVLAYLNEDSGGTWYTVNYAVQANKEIFVI